MATIGLDKLFYAEITEDSDGNETYGVPASLAKAISADLSVELAEATLYADDGASEIVKEFKSGTLSLGIDDIGNDAASVLTGATIDSNNVVISTSEDGGKPVAIGFRAKKSNGKYRYFWLYRVKFGIPSLDELLTKVKQNLILEHSADDELIKGFITAAVSYAESYQHLPENYYSENAMQPTTEQAVIMLSSHFYESRDGSTGGFFGDNVQAGKQVWNTVNMLLRLDRRWKV